jgi:hypothetical protein
MLDLGMNTYINCELAIADCERISYSTIRNHKYSIEKGVN